MKVRKVLIGAALNGEREHPAAPRTAIDLARAARAAASAGAGVVHLHPFDAGRETLEPGPCGEAIAAVRDLCPGIPISLSTSAGIEPDPARRLALLERWEVLPDLVSANQGEEGILEVCELMRSRGVEIEAGLLCHRDAEAFVGSPVTDYAVRVLLEPLDGSAQTACDHAGQMERILDSAGVRQPQMHHGVGSATWAVTERALARGHDVRTGIEDTGHLPDGTQATDNAQLVEAVAELIRSNGLAIAISEA